jgi:hypothetical protein
LIDENKELWLGLCEQAAAVERDPEKWNTLVNEINRLLEERRSRLNNKARTCFLILLRAPAKASCQQLLLFQGTKRFVGPYKIESRLR